MGTGDSTLLDASERLLQRLRPGDLEATLENITAAAVEVLPRVDYCSITMRQSDGRLHTYAATDDVLIDLDMHQFELQEGPCYDGATNTTHSVSPDLRADPRYPRYGERAAAVGIRSQAGLRLFENKKSIAALNLYACEVDALEDLATLGRLFAHQAAVALRYSWEVETLQEAVQTRTTIGQAVGIVMERYQIPEQQAFAFLLRLSSHRNVKLRQVAEELVASVTGR
jgi:hypothetical protein